MGYVSDKFNLINSIEYEYKYAGKYGAKGESRAPKIKPTPEQIQKQNQRNRENRVRRLIKLNFWPSDLWATLKYPAGIRKPLEEVKKDIRNFLDAMRREYKKYGEALKYIYRLEIGERGGVHIHILFNRLHGIPDTDIILQAKWKQGRVYYASIHEAGGYKDLAAYIVKVPTEELEGQLHLFPAEEQKVLRSYSTSRNLIRPVPERKEYSHRTMRKLLEQVAKDGQPAPTEGYYIDRDSIRCGINPYTGMSYLHYTEVRIKPVERPEKGG